MAKILNKNNFMLAALDEAQKAGERGEIPVGAVIVHNNSIIAKAGNRSRQYRNATAHAELLAIQIACRKLQNEYLRDCDLYVTLEPCIMCAGAIALTHMRRLYYGARNPKCGAIEQEPQLFYGKNSFFRPEIYPGIAEEPARQLLEEFFKQLRQ